jgi:hypothetical protein
MVARIVHEEAGALGPQRPDLFLDFYGPGMIWEVEFSFLILTASMWRELYR